ALQQLLKNGDTRAVNLGIGHGASVRPVIYIARRNIGLEIWPRYVARGRDPPVLMADLSFKGFCSSQNLPSDG
ncbi:MAG: hypothetical protein WCD73_01230, partial [Pseudolabrys sp.]